MFKLKQSTLLPKTLTNVQNCNIVMLLLANSKMDYILVPDRWGVTGWKYEKPSNLQNSYFNRRHSDNFRNQA